MPAMEVTGKTAIITGAGSGINLAFAQLVASKGCNVVIADIALSPAAQEFVSSPPPSAKVLYKRCDVALWADLAALFPFCKENGLGTADIVVPGAGVFEPPWSSFFWGEQDEASVAASRYKTLDINLVHPIRLTRLAITEFLAAGKEQAAVVHVSSVCGQVPKFSAPIYVATKHGVSGFVKSMARLEPEFGVRVAGVCPGIIKTPLWTDHPEKLQMMDEELDDWATPEEVAVAMLRLIEEEGMKGGTLLEVGKDQTRIVEMYNDPGPPFEKGKGHRLSKAKLLDDQAVELLIKEKAAAAAVKEKV
ncbi:NAD-dependent 15-hydroxyprostaglandin dehydrogenase [Sphaerosporella brunnea]|uniref:NAD-dependent 15-hydroxyprostaglandin dehydrogenase n=1 Tax=Sphaerosporella brunnea TaxID=1250544 RepID=A0A5J5EQG4_9PEZI|nr:NAD-dependent 15-hydroxyprostaglandin dehydrogenase [Sphaerosporella brunnea]